MPDRRRGLPNEEDRDRRCRRYLANVGYRGTGALPPGAIYLVDNILLFTIVVADKRGQ